ncbi:MAG: GDP-mannose 4,6-dehydratase [Thermoanaerobaculia bacterium]
MKKALITGITGQDGSYLAEYLLSLGYEVYGIVRRVASENEKHRYWRILNILDKVKLIPASLENYGSIFKAVKDVMPDECYHLAAQSFVSWSFEDEFSTLQINILGTSYILSAVKELCPSCRVYFAGSSEMFGRVEEVPQTEKTPFHPRSPYGISKVAGFHLVQNYREAYNLFAVTGILYNHESPRRGFEFVTRKISSGVAKIKLGLEKKLKLGNLEAKRDWGDAREYVKVMNKMLQQKEPEDFLIATGETHSVREFCEIAFDIVGLKWQEWVEIDEKLFRPAEVDLLIGNPEKAKKKLGWNYTKKFEELIEDMVKYDLKYFKDEIA